MGDVFSDICYKNCPSPCLFLFGLRQVLCQRALPQEAEYFSQLIEITTLWNEEKTNFITIFSEGRIRLGRQLGIEHCWLDDMEKGIPNAQQNAERATQKRQQKQRYIDYNLRQL